MITIATAMNLTRGDSLGSALEAPAALAFSWANNPPWALIVLVVAALIVLWAPKPEHPA